LKADGRYLLMVVAQIITEVQNKGDNQNAHSRREHTDSGGEDQGAAGEAEDFG
jgi:hypothetical protein